MRIFLLSGAIAGMAGGLELVGVSTVSRTSFPRTLATTALPLPSSRVRHSPSCR